MSYTSRVFPIVLLILCACEGAAVKQQQNPSGQSVSGASTTPAATTAGTVGRFAVFQSVGPADLNVTLRVDTSTGETWRLDLAPPVSWVPVKDNLRAVGVYNPATKKIEWGTKLPDGRDIHDLSKEELIRWVEPIISGAHSTNPKDPLGLFENEPRPQTPQ